MALGIIALARETGWTEGFIREELPLARFLVYRHAQLWLRGAWTVPVAPPVADEAEQLGILL